MRYVSTKKSLALSIGVLLSCYAVGFTATVYAEDSDNQSTTDSAMEFYLDEVTVEAKRPDWESKLSPGSVTVVKPEEFKGEEKTLPDMLQAVPGVHVREVNGKGQYTTVTMRGSTAAQVGVFIDGVLANLGGDSAVDLSTIPVKNVERIETYRGYIPARFGGTYMGGVINIVTKKPEGTHVNVELGKSSYGGKKGSLEVTAPLGSGTIMVGTNYESSDGDFKYKNYAAARQIPEYEKEIKSAQTYLDTFNSDNIDLLTKNNIISLTGEQIDYYKSNSEAWESYVQSEAGSGNSLTDAITDNSRSYAEGTLKKDLSVLEDKLVDLGLMDEYLDTGIYEDFNWLEGAEADWNGDGLGILTPEMKEQLTKDYADSIAAKNIDHYVASVDPAKNLDVAQKKQLIEEKKRQIKNAKNSTRYRKYNDYEKTNTIVKWQDKNWVIKGSYNTMDRHLPDSVWGGDGWHSAMLNNEIDLKDIMYYTSRRQKQTNADLLLQNRHQHGKLEWGWMLDYLKADKKYRAEKITYSNPWSYWDAVNTPLRTWSEYNSNKYTGQIDGSYKVNDRNMIDFLLNYSKERMKIRGSGLDTALSGSESQNSIVWQTRDKYEQELLNFQIQDSITLDKKGSWIFTPNLRYNSSKITGYSNGARFANGMYKWINPKDSQTDSKLTWQLALKKKFDDHLTLRMTGGTYYRLLNMYEIAGDGAGILPAPGDWNGNGAVFPMPEDGKQFDFSIMTENKFLGADNATTLTYYWRQSDNMLMLTRKGKDYYCYFNDNKGKSNGIELQSNFKWSKFDLDMQVTYLSTKAWNKNSVTGHNYTPINATYQPKWEGNVRVTYRPTDKFSLFTEGHYTGDYQTYYAIDAAHGNPVSKLLVVNGGIKLTPNKNWQLTFGCNDILNRGPKLKINTSTFGYDNGYVNPEYPIQGRTYYVTARYQF